MDAPKNFVTSIGLEAIVVRTNSQMQSEAERDQQLLRCTFIKRPVNIGVLLPKKLDFWHIWPQTF